jgi:putative serine protease PepD
VKADCRHTADSQPTSSLFISRAGTVTVMTDREHAQPPDRQQPSWPLADASQRHPADTNEPRTYQPRTYETAAAQGAGQSAGPQPAPAATPVDRGIAGPYPPGSGPYAQPTSAFRGPGTSQGYPASGFQPAGYPPPGYQPGRGFPPTGPLGLPAPGAPGQHHGPGQHQVPGQHHVPGQHYVPGQPGIPASTAWPGRRGGKRIAVAAGVLALMLSSGVVGGAVATQFDNESTATATAARTPTVTAAQTGSLADVVAAVSPSVVSINVTLRGGSGTGSGVIIDGDGTILTNAHVVATATRIQVLLSNGKTVEARLIGADTNADVALIQAQDAGALTPASLATGSTPRVGDTVLAFGSPLGLEGSVTAGIVSSVDRQVEGRSSTLSGMIQTDAAINPGNSGGPLVNASGQVVGINTAIATTGDSGGNIGVGFAIPIDTAMQVANGLRSR